MENDLDEDSTATVTATESTATANLDNLQQDLLLRILSFLPTLDTITTSLISKKWRYLWSLVPSLNFSYSQFPPYQSFTTTRQNFTEFIYGTIANRPQWPLQKFRLGFIYGDRFGHHVDTWVRYAIRNRVLELDLDFFIDKSYHIGDFETRAIYDFPFYTLENGDVSVLRLCGCDLTLPAHVKNMRLWRMKEIYFVHIYMTDDMALDLLKACPNLEILKFEDCYGMENLRLYSETLKRLDLLYFCTAEKALYLELDCPNLLSLTIDCFEMGEFCVKNLSSLVEFRTFITHKLEFYGQWSKVVRQLHQMANIRHLVVQNWWLKFAPKDVFPNGFLLYNVKHLELQTEYTQYDLLGMAALLELCPNLETMILDHLCKIDIEETLSEELLNKPINLSIPKLKEIKLKAYILEHNQEQLGQFVALLKKQGVALEKIVVVPLANGNSCPPIVLRKRPPRVEISEEFTQLVETNPEQ